VASTVWIGTSWKMTKTLDEARAFVQSLVSSGVPEGVQPFIVPAHTALSVVRECLPDDTSVLLGAQNAHWAEEGAGTGEISMRMVVDAGASLVELGHSERREQFGETDETVALKVRAAVDAGLTPLVCVGDPARVRDRGAAPDFVSAQVRIALSMLRPEERAKVVVAYEPVWAIGEAGRPAEPEEVSPVMTAIAEEVVRGSGGRECLALLYGGSVDPGNAASLLRDASADGLFVGRAAWDIQGFLSLLAIAGAHAARPAEETPFGTQAAAALRD
jgi:L-erythrulose 1-phosphate isomerase